MSNSDWPAENRIDAIGQNGNTGEHYGEATKHDNGKPRVDLVPPEVVLELAKVLGFGANEYGERNWEQGMDWGRVYAALQRHILAWWSGKDTDDDSGFSHLSHAACCIAFLIAYEKRGIGTDTRSKTNEQE